MSAHLNILLKYINFEGISLKVCKHIAKSISIRLFQKHVSFQNKYFNYLHIDYDIYNFVKLKWEWSVLNLSMQAFFLFVMFLKSKYDDISYEMKH